MKREQASEPDMEGMLESSDRELKTTMTNMLRALTDKVAGMWGQVGNVSTETEIPRTNQKETLQVKITVTEMKNTFHEFISRLDTAEERISKVDIYQ